MTVFALLAAKGRPGVSTWATALMVAWPVATGRQVLLLDLDVSGAGPVSEYQRYGLGDGRGLLGWVAAAGRSSLEDQMYALDGDGTRWLVPGLPDATGAASVGEHWPAFVEAIERTCEERELDVLVDLGRWGSRHEATPVRDAADVVVLVLRSTFESVSLTQAVRSLLPQAPAQRRAALLVGERAPYGAGEVSKALGVEVVAALPMDVRGVRRLAGARSADTVPSRSPLARAAHVAAARLSSLAKESSSV